MRFHVGPPPQSPEFTPEPGGWNKLREPGAWVMQLLALPIAALTGVLLLAAVWLLGTVHAPSGGGVPGIGDSAGQVLAVFVALIPLHELIHVLAHPGNGLTPDSVLGVWPSRVLFYAHYMSALSRKRFLVIL